MIKLKDVLARLEAAGYAHIAQWLREDPSETNAGRLCARIPSMLTEHGDMYAAIDALEEWEMECRRTRLSVPPRETRADALMVLLRQPGWSFTLVNDHVVQARAVAEDATRAELESMVKNACALKHWSIYQIIDTDISPRIFIIKVLA